MLEKAWVKALRLSKVSQAAGGGRASHALYTLAML